MDLYSICEYSSDILCESINLCYTDLYRDDCITEKTLTKLTSAIKTFFRDLRIQIENLITEIRLQYMSVKRRKEFKKKVKEYYDSARAHKTTGDRKTIEMIDLWAYKEAYLEMNNELWKYAKKFASVEYQHLSDIDDDMHQFNSIIDSYAKKLEKIQEKTIIVPVDKVIRFYEDETTGNSDVIKTLQKNMDEFQKMESEAINLEKRADRYGPEILPKKINFIRKMVLAITNRINKAVIKFMTLLILIF